MINFTFSAHAWTEKSNALKRRRAESDSIVDKKKPSNGVTNLSEQFNFINSSEITLTLIPKSKSRGHINSLETQTKVSPIEQSHQICNDDKVEEKNDVMSIIGNYGEIQLTKLGSTQNVKTTSSSNVNATSSTADKFDKPENLLEQKSDFLTSTSGLNELSEITIEPRSTSQKSKLTNSPSTSSDESTVKRVTKSQARIDQAQDLLKKKLSLPSCEVALIKTTTKKESNVGNEKFAVRSDSPTVKQNLNNFSQQETSPFFDEEPENVPVTVPASDSDFQGFNEVGITCSRFYSKSKDKPHYTLGFPNLPMENRCWANATFQVLFALPPINNIHNLQDASKRSKLLNHLISIQTIWRTGSPRNYNYDNCFK